MKQFWIEVLNQIKGVSFDDAYKLCQSFIQEHVEVKYIHLKLLLQSKEAAGRYKNKDDIEWLINNNIWHLLHHHMCLLNNPHHKYALHVADIFYLT